MKTIRQQLDALVDKILHLVSAEAVSAPSHEQSTGSIAVQPSGSHAPSSMLVLRPATLVARGTEARHGRGAPGARRRLVSSSWPRRRLRVHAAAVRSAAASEGWSPACPALVVVRCLRWRGVVAAGMWAGGEDGDGGGRLGERVERTVAMAGTAGEDGDVVG